MCTPIYTQESLQYYTLSLHFLTEGTEEEEEAIGSTVEEIGKIKEQSINGNTQLS